MSGETAQKSVPAPRRANAARPAPGPAPRPAPAAPARRPTPPPQRTAGDASLALTDGMWRLLLANMHSRIFDRRAGKMEFVDTARFVSLGDDDFEHADRVHGYDYRPTPRRVLRWALERLDIDFPETTFVDFGSGRGRAVLEAARFPFARCVGIELSPTLHEDAEQNLRHWPRSVMKCRDVDFIEGSIATTPLPDGPLMVWMFNPATDRVVIRVAARLAEAASAGRQITLAYLDPRHATTIRQASMFRSVRVHDWRLKWLSPWPIEFYRLGGDSGV
ncbi:MAG: class I SAM-dependent methyltransferase [Flavobacteriaceae bacterium]